MMKFVDIQAMRLQLLIAVCFLTIIYLVGAAGLAISEVRPYFKALTPLNLLLSTILLMMFQRPKSNVFLIWSCVIISVGYFIEVIGVHSRIVFGEYQYGDTLGWTLLQVPPIIGVNWLLLTYTAGMLSKKIGGTTWRQTTLGAILMVGLDILIEPVAIAMDFWEWEQAHVPLQNYIGWFIIAWAMIWTFHKVSSEWKNALAIPMYLIQAGFFIILNIVLIFN